MNRCLMTLVLLVVVILPGQSGEPASVKEALQALNDFIGGWKGNGTSEKDKSETWNEALSWSWRFKGKDAWLTFEIAKGKHFQNGELRYLADKKRYQLTLLDKTDKKRVFEGELKKGRLVLERVDDATKETQQLQMNLAGGGVRFIYAYAVRPENRTLFSKEFQVAFTKEGESFGTAVKKVECIVTGGLGTIAVNFQGKTFYVCCSGCRDAFSENPAHYIKEAEAKKKAGK
jgi:hypothetical protein